MREISRCDLCGGQSFIRLYSQRIDYVQPWSGFIATGLFPLCIHGMLCRRCGYIFQTPAYEETELAKLYGNVEPDGCQGQACASESREASYQRSTSIYRTVEPWLPPRRIKMLDVGGRRGELMQTFIAAGHDVSVLDIGAETAAHEAVRIIQGSFLGWAAERFDLIIMSHVLEHTDAPTAFLEHGSTLLTDDGLLYVEVPFELPTPLVRRHAGDHRHLGYFTNTTLRAFLQKTGYDCLYCRQEIDWVGTSLISVIRAVARKRRGHPAPGAWRPRPLMAVSSLLALFNPMYWLARVTNKLRRV